MPFADSFQEVIKVLNVARTITYRSFDNDDRISKEFINFFEISSIFTVEAVKKKFVKIINATEA